MHERHLCARAEQLQRRDGGRVLPADDEDALAVVCVRIAIVVGDVRLILAWNAEAVRVVVVSDGEHHRARVAPAPHTAVRPTLDDEERVATAAVVTLDRQHLLAEDDVQAVAVGDPPVVPQRFVACRFFVGRDKRQLANLQQIGGREERHLRGEVEDRVDQDPLFDDLVIQLGIGGGDGDSEPGGSSANDEQIADGHHVIVDATRSPPGRPASSPIRRRICPLNPAVGPLAEP